MRLINDLTEIPSRIDNKIIEVPFSGCWIWMGTTNGRYGMVTYDGKWTYTHRVMYELFVAKIPVDLEIDHLCRTPLCVRPDHLEAVTHVENSKRRYEHSDKESFALITQKAIRAASKARKNKIHCKQGHPWSTENTRIYRGFRFCRACDRNWKRIKRHKDEN